MFRPAVVTHRVPVANKRILLPLRHLFLVSRSSSASDCTILHSFAASCDDHAPLPVFPADALASPLLIDVATTARLTAVRCGRGDGRGMQRDAVRTPVS
jgi:hypothetical protein